MLKGMHNSRQRIVVDPVDGRIKLAHLGSQDVLKALLHIVERDFVSQALVALAFQIPRQRKLKAAEAAKAKLAAEARNGRLGRGGGARELSRREAWRLGLVLQYIVDNTLLGLAVSLMGTNEGKCALATIGHGWLLVGMKIGLVL